MSLYGCRVPRVGLVRRRCGGASRQPPLGSTIPAPRCLHLSLAIHHNLYTRLSPPYTSPSIYTSPSTYTTPPPNTSPQCSPLPIVHLTPLPHLTPLATLHFCLALHQDANWAITTPGNSMALLYLFGNHGQRASLRWGAVWLAPPHSCVAGLAWGSRCPWGAGVGWGLPRREVGLRAKPLACQSPPLPLYKYIQTNILYYLTNLNNNFIYIDIQYQWLCSKPSVIGKSSIGCFTE